MPDDDTTTRGPLPSAPDTVHTVDGPPRDIAFPLHRVQLARPDEHGREPNGQPDNQLTS